jgi:hypothetical protein
MLTEVQSNDESVFLKNFHRNLLRLAKQRGEVVPRRKKPGSSDESSDFHRQKAKKSPNYFAAAWAVCILSEEASLLNQQALDPLVRMQQTCATVQK